MTTSNAVTNIELEKAIDAYCDACLARVDGFVAQQLSLRGAFKLNRYALGWDLLRLPLNIAWAPLWLILQLAAAVSKSLGDNFFARACQRVPAGMQTSVQAELQRRVQQQLLQQTDDGADPLLKHLLAQRGISPQAWQQLLETPQSDSGRERLRLRLFGARTAVAEITSNLSMAVAGAVLFKQFTPGAIGGGVAMAAWWSNQQAVSQFWAGDMLGKVWFGWFPPEVDWITRISATGLLMLLLALLAALSGFVTDPLQTAVGLHQRRLRKLIEHMRQELKQDMNAANSTQEQYLARVTDVLDWAAMLGRAVG